MRTLDLTCPTQRDFEYWYFGIKVCNQEPAVYTADHPQFINRLQHEGLAGTKIWCSVAELDRCSVFVQALFEHLQTRQTGAPSASSFSQQAGHKAAAVAASRTGPLGPEFSVASSEQTSPHSHQGSAVPDSPALQSVGTGPVSRKTHRIVTEVRHGLHVTAPHALLLATSVCAACQAQVRHNTT